MNNTILLNFNLYKPPSLSFAPFQTEEFGFLMFNRVRPVTWCLAQGVYPILLSGLAEVASDHGLLREGSNTQYHQYSNTHFIENVETEGTNLEGTTKWKDCGDR